MITQGVGVYSTTFCLIVGSGVTGKYHDDVKSNCGVSTAPTAEPASLYTDV
jgi:hypothetical protein